MQKQLLTILAAAAVITSTSQADEATKTEQLFNDHNKVGQILFHTSEEEKPGLYVTFAGEEKEETLADAEEKTTKLFNEEKEETLASTDKETTKLFNEEKEETLADAEEKTTKLFNEEKEETLA